MSLLDSLVGGLIPGLGNPFGLPSQGLWNLQKGSFTTSDKGQTVFFVENSIGQLPGELSAIDTISDSGGRRLAVYEYPYIDGQAIQDLGRKGEHFTFNIKFFGQNYQLMFKEFIENITKSNQKGTLNHPVRGSFPARFLEWEYIHRHDEWNSVTIKATFLEDDTDQISSLNLLNDINSMLRNGLQVLSSVTSTITSGLAEIVAIKNLPSSILKNLQSQFKAITATVSSLFGQLGATYSSDAQLQTLFSTAVNLGNVLLTNGGVVTATTSNPTGQLPPVYQVGFSPADQTNITAQLSSFVNANQITPQQAMYQANQARSEISTAIQNINTELGNDGYSIVLQYRILAVQIQLVTQAAISSVQAQIKQYVVPRAMSLRMVAFLNGLTPDRQNDIEALNPYITSINYVEAGVILQVPSV